MAPQPPLHDPNNHVPTVGDDDGWDDAWSQNPASAVLPPRRHGPAADAGPMPASPRPVVNFLAGPPTPPDIGDAPKHKTSIEVFKLDVTELAARLVVEEEGMTPQVPRATPAGFKPRPGKNPSGMPRGENHEWGVAHHRHAASRWLWASGGGVLLMVGVAVAAWPRYERMQQAPLSALYESLEIIDSRPTGEVFEVQRLLNELPIALRMTGDYLAAKRSEDILGLVRDPGRLADVISSAWRPADIPDGWRPTAAEDWSGDHLNDRAVAMLHLRLPDHRPFTAYFVEDEDGALKIDWEATTGHGSATVAELADGHGDGSCVRALLTTATFHTAAFPEADWRSFRLLSPDRRHTVWAYAKRGGDAEAALMENLPLGEILGDRKEHPVTVALDPPGPDARPGQWILRAKLHKGWVSP